jgi:hypothetical protein
MRQSIALPPTEITPIEAALARLDGALAEGKSNAHRLRCWSEFIRERDGRFRIRAKLTDREGGGQFLYSYFGWHAEIVS